MIILFGPAGAGKTVQGQLLAKKNGWEWLSVGQVLRTSHNPELINVMSKGELAPQPLVDSIVEESIKKIEKEKIVLDGFPREINQARWLVDFCKKNHREIDLVIVINVPESEVMRRLSIRARNDDLPDSIRERLRIYNEQINPILDYFKDNNKPIVTIDGIGSVSDIHDRICKELKDKRLI